MCRCLTNSSKHGIGTWAQVRKHGLDELTWRVREVSRKTWLSRMLRTGGGGGQSEEIGKIVRETNT